MKTLAFLKKSWASLRRGWSTVWDGTFLLLVFFLYVLVQAFLWVVTLGKRKPRDWFSDGFYEGEETWR